MQIWTNSIKYCLFHFARPGLAGCKHKTDLCTQTHSLFSPPSSSPSFGAPSIITGLTGVSSGFFSSSLSSAAGLNYKNIFSHVHNSIKLVTKKRIVCITFALQICVELCSKYMQKLDKNRLCFSPPYFLLHTWSIVWCCFPWQLFVLALWD